MPINLTQTAKELRHNATDAEQLLWRHLRARQMSGLKFRRQEQIGRFVVDFVCYERRLIVEADGGQHALEQAKDVERTRWLNAQGFTVVRFWNHEILTNCEGVLESIRRSCLEPPLPPPPPTEGRGSKADNTFDFAGLPSLLCGRGAPLTITIFSPLSTCEF